MEITSEHKTVQRIVFMGTPLFATYTLQAMNREGYRPILVITQPDAARGRNLHLSQPPVKIVARDMDIPVIQPEDINDDEVLRMLLELAPDIIVTAAYGGYIGKKIRRLPKFGCINLHPSLLPKYRGASPIHTALLNGDAITGNTIYRLTSKIDAGPMYLQEPLVIHPTHDLTSLEHDLAVQGADLVVKALRLIPENAICECQQDQLLATYTSKIDQETQKLEWNSTASEIYNRIRSLSVEPGAMTLFRAKPMKVLTSFISDKPSTLAPGSVASIEKNTGILIATKDFDLLITSVLPAGKKRMDAYSFHLGARIQEGEQFGQ